jgi:flagellar biosynthesis protein FliQ
MGRLVLITLVLVVLVAVFLGIDSQKEKHYVFDPKVLHEVAAQAIETSSSTEELFTKIGRELAKRYPGHIEEEQECRKSIHHFYTSRLGSDTVDLQGFSIMQEELWEPCGFYILQSPSM